MSGTKTDDEAKGQKEKSSLPLVGAKVLDTQVGGHRYGTNGKKLGMLDRGNGIVLKAVQTPPRGTRELNLYQTVFSPTCKDTDLLELRNFLPPYYGTEIFDGATFLIMHNLSHRFVKPNVLDLKMGRVTYDPEATPEKREHEVSKYPPLKDLGFQLTGMMMHEPPMFSAQHFHKPYCRSFTAETMLTDGLGKFFGLKDGHLRKDVLKVLLGKLQRIEDWFLVQRTYAFYASSLLIVYSSSPPPCEHSAGAATEKSESGIHADSSPGNNSDHSPPEEKSVNNSNGSNAARDSKGESSSAVSCDQHPSLKRTRNPHSDADCAELDSAPTTAKLLKPSPDCMESNEETEERKATRGEKADLGSCERDQVPLVEVRMIDFAHVFPSTVQDDNYLFGLQKLISHVKQLLEM